MSACVRSPEEAWADKGSGKSRALVINQTVAASVFSRSRVRR